MFSQSGKAEFWIFNTCLRVAVRLYRNSLKVGYLPLQAAAQLQLSGTSLNLTI